MSEVSPVPIPVEEASKLGRAFRKAIVWIVAYDRVDDRTHLVTWALDVQHKQFAAYKGTRILESLGFLSIGAISHEDFRTRPAAEAAAEIDQLRATIRDLKARLGES